MQLDEALARIAELEAELATALHATQATFEYCNREVSRAYGSVGKTCNVYEDGLLRLLPEIGGLRSMDPEEARRVVDVVSARIAALEAQNAKLREAITNIRSYESSWFTAGTQGDATLIEMCDAALALPADATALNEVRAQAWEEAAKACDNARHPQSYSGYVEGRNWLCDELSEQFLSRAAALRKEAQR